MCVSIRGKYICRSVVPMKENHTASVFSLDIGQFVTLSLKLIFFTYSGAVDSMDKFAIYHHSRGKIILFINFKFEKSLLHEALSVWILRNDFKYKDNFGRDSWKSNFVINLDIKILSMLLFFRFHISSFQMSKTFNANRNSMLSRGITDLK